MKTKVDQCEVLDLKRVHSLSGNLTFISNNKDIPFSIKRIYYLYDVPGGAERGGHAHHELEQLIVAASGSFELVLDDGSTKRTVILNRPDQGIYIKKKIWRELINFSSGAICLVLASQEFYEEDYIREYNEFLIQKNG